MIHAKFVISDENDENVTLSDSNDPGSNFYNTLSLESLFLSPKETREKILELKHDFSILNINIKSLSKNFENFKILL